VLIVRIRLLTQKKGTNQPTRPKRAAACNWPGAAAPAEEGLVIRDIGLLRLRALLARARGDAAAYAHLRDRCRDMARSLGFEGHIAWAEAMA
jgi:hypothetical protein